MARRLSRDALMSELAPVVSSQGCDLEDVEVVSAGRRSVVRVLVDRDGGIDLDLVAQVSTAVSAMLDESPTFGDSPYVLEVSSPGIGRPLSQPRHWRRAIGRLVQITTRDHRVVTGRVTTSDDDAAVVDLAGGEQRISYADVADARVQVEFARKVDDSDDLDDLDGSDDVLPTDNSEDEA